jgi:hypothetical protein
VANLGQLRAQVRAIADVDANDVSDADINTYINDAYQEAIADEQWPFLLSRVSFNTVANESDYLVSTIASDTEPHRILFVATQGQKLQKVETTDYLSLEPFGQTETTGNPSAWTTLDGTKLVLWPSPNAVIAVQVVYLKIPPDLTQDSDTPQFPSRYHYILKWGGLRYVYTKIGDLESAEGALKQFDESAQAMAADLVRSTPQTTLVWGWNADQKIPSFGRLRYPWE